ncbi:MAG: metallophosphoesterase [Fibrobacterales bacterium]|nr:metallophosphoesterase [Fibrobacterales bacterium]
MSPQLKIAQISDIHLGAGADRAQQEFYLANFRRVWKAVLAEKPDAVVFSGDMTDHGTEKELDLLKREIEGAKIPLFFVSGNHDDSARLISALSLPSTQGKLVYRFSLGGVEHFVLDSSANRVDSWQLDWLEGEAGKEKGPCALWIHHPPSPCGSLFMDTKWPLLDHGPVLERLKGIPSIRHVFCGHYHSGKSVEAGGLLLHLAPATQFQISDEEPGFAIASSEPGWQTVEWRGDEVEVTVRFA